MLEIRTISEKTEREIAVCIKGMPEAIAARLVGYINTSCSMGPRHAHLSDDGREIIAYTHSNEDQEEFMAKVKKFLSGELGAPASQ